MSGSGSGRGGRGGRGAPPIAETLQPLLAIVDAFSRPHPTVTASGVAYMLGLDDERAAHALELVRGAAQGAGDPEDVLLPLEYGEEGELIARDGSPWLAPQRMTTAEADACERLLSSLGIGPDAFGGFRRALQAGLYPVGYVSPATLPSPKRGGLFRTLVACLDALYRNEAVTFRYHGEGSDRRRRVEPLSVTYHFDHWILIGLDLDEVGARPEAPLMAHRRFFDIQGISEVAPCGEPCRHMGLRDVPWDDSVPIVRLYFSDRDAYFDVPEWTWSTPVPEDELTEAERARIGAGGVAVDIAYFGDSVYLARLVAAQGGACTTDDAALNAAVRAYVGALAETLGLP